MDTTPDAVRRGQVSLGTEARLVLPETGATTFEVLITLNLEAMEHLWSSRNWQRWVKAPGP